MKKVLLGLIAAISLTFSVQASTPALPDEGMWLPMFLERLNYTDMQKMGLNLTAEELYSINNSSLKDAIFGLASGSAPGGYFCTAEAISPTGLLLTNHHCGYGAIQSHSSTETDYLKNGFWAMSKDQELLNEGMTASFLQRMEDVTSKVFGAVDDEMSESDKKAAMADMMDDLQTAAEEDGQFQVTIKPFFEGNEYYMFVYKTYRDVRLVGAPPSSIGKFGGDTDNWMWPRHTGDFSILRVYTDKDGEPADFSNENIPLKPKHYLPISLKGVKKDDFAMIWGYPGTTDRFLTSHGIKLAVEESNPELVTLMGSKLELIKEDMDADPKVKIQYASKYSSTANYWKYLIGQTKGLKQLKVYDKKKAEEDAFTKWVNKSEDRKKEYGTALSLIEKGYLEKQKTNSLMNYLNFAVFGGAEYIAYSFGFIQLHRVMQMEDELDKNEKGKYEDMIKSRIDGAKEGVKDHFKDYNKSTDQKVFVKMMKMFYDNVDKQYHPEAFTNILEKKYKGDFNKWAEAIYSKSFLVDEQKMNEFLNDPSYKVLSKDPGFILTLDLMKIARSIFGSNPGGDEFIDEGNHLYVKGLMEMQPKKKFYPNANSTLRFTYGKVGDYIPKDAVTYDFVTTLEGVMEKEDPTVEEFMVDPKLKELYKKKDYGQYVDASGKMVLCFITDHDITGGNSGSPVINADGHLIGCAFDGNWEAMSGDIAFEKAIQRTISVDIRYVLFVVDKVGGASHLIDEMTLIK